MPRRRAPLPPGPLAEARLAVLGVQLRSHFLLNALNTAAELVHHDAAAADRVLTALGGLLAHAVRHDGVRAITLREELALLDRYFDVERARLGARLDVVCDVEDAALDARVPPLVLQPLAENAVRHGLAPRMGGGTVLVCGARDGAALRLTIADDGVGFVPARARDGVGLSNVRARLHALYGPAHRVAIASRPGRGTTVTLRLPWRADRGIE